MWAQLSEPKGIAILRNLKLIQTSFPRLDCWGSNALFLEQSTQENPSLKHCQWLFFTAAIKSTISELNHFPLCFGSTADHPFISLTVISMGTTSLERPLSGPFHKPIVSISRQRVMKPLAQFFLFLGSDFHHF